MTCPKCERAVAPVDLFCGFCGAKVAALAPAARAAAVSHGPVVPSRRAAGVATVEVPKADAGIEAAARAVGPGRGAAASAVPILAPDGVAAETPVWFGDARPAGFSARAGAYLIDGLLLLAWLAVAVGVAAASRLAPLFAHGAHPAVLAAEAARLPEVMPWALALWAPIAALYPVAFLALEGATPGKMIMRLRVVRPGGGEVGVRRAALRELAGGLLTTLTLGLAFLAVAFSADKRGLHDRLGGTLVVRLP